MIGGAVSMNKKEEEGIGESSLWTKTKVYLSGMLANVLLSYIIFSTIVFLKLSVKFSILYSIFWSLVEGFFYSFVLWVCAIPLSIKVILAGKVSMSEAVAGPIGIVQIMHGSFYAGLINFLLMVAIVNVSIAAMNLLPLFPLDGGHMFIAIVERFFPKCKKFIGLFQAIGFMLIILLIIAVLTKDIWTVFLGGGYSFPIK